MRWTVARLSRSGDRLAATTLEQRSQAGRPGVLGAGPSRFEFRKPRTWPEARTDPTAGAYGCALPAPSAFACTHV